jgi:hypothetical protein
VLPICEAKLNSHRSEFSTRWAVPLPTVTGVSTSLDEAQWCLWMVLDWPSGEVHLTNCALASGARPENKAMREYRGILFIETPRHHDRGAEPNILDLFSSEALFDLS